MSSRQAAARANRWRLPEDVELIFGAGQPDEPVRRRSRTLAAAAPGGESDDPPQPRQETVDLVLSNWVAAAGRHLRAAGASGCQVGDPELHNQVAECALQAEVSYRDAVLRVAAEQRSVDAPADYRGWEVGDLELHNRVTDRVREAGISYGEAVLQVGREQRPVDVPAEFRGLQVGGLELHNRVAKCALQAGISYRDAVLRVAREG